MPYYMYVYIVIMYMVFTAHVVLDHLTMTSCFKTTMLSVVLIEVTHYGTNCDYTHIFVWPRPPQSTNTAQVLHNF